MAYKLIKKGLKCQCTSESFTRGFQSTVVSWANNAENGVEIMEEQQNVLNQDENINDGDDVANGGVGPGDAEEQGAQDADHGHADKDDPYGVKKRLGMQAKKHQREMRQVQEQMMRLQSQMGHQAYNPYSESQNVNNTYHSPGQPDAPGMSEEDKIQRAVRMALGMKEHEEKQARAEESKAHVHKQYQRLNDEFDKAADKYDDFDDIVRGDDAPFTPHVRDALLLVDNPAEVAYRLGKDRSKLSEISKLHPLDQAREVNKLSFALMGGNSGKPQSSPSKSNPMGTIRANPAASSTAVTDKTPPSAIRARMKAGTWK